MPDNIYIYYKSIDRLYFLGTDKDEDLAARVAGKNKDHIVFYGPLGFA